MDVVIDAGPIGGKAPVGGIATYTRHLLAGLSQIPDLTIHARATPMTPLPVGIKRMATRPVFERGRPGYWEHEIRRALDRRVLTAPLFHNPHPHAPIFRPRRWIQTLHDVIPLVFDDPLMKSVRRRFVKYGPRYALADTIICVSQHAADEGIRVLGLDPRRIEIIHNGVDPSFVPSDAPTESGPPYVSVVSEFSPRKGFGEAFAVISLLAEWGYPHRLAVAGRVPTELRPALNQLVEAAPRRDRIDLSDFVEDLVSFYQGASVHLMTTRYEGFGLPALEAMACGVPVVAFDNSSIPEVVGDAGLIVPDGDVAAAAKSIRLLLDNENLREELRQRGIERARMFTWERTARAHADVYRAAVAS